MGSTEEHVKATQAMLHNILQRHTCVVHYVSGGKDSLTLMHLLCPWRDRVMLLHNKVDQGWPGCTENVLALAEAWGFSPPTLTTPLLTFDEYVAAYGYQAEIVPSVYDTVIQPPSPFQTGPMRVSSWWHCTLLRQIYPLIEATVTLGADAVLTGSRGSDAPAFATMGAETDAEKARCGFTRYNPLQAWTTEEVYAYIDVHQIPLPPHYQWKRALGEHYEFPDCIRCTWQPEHWRLLREHYPEIYATYWPETKHVYEALAAKQWAYTKRVMLAVMEGSS